MRREPTQRLLAGRNAANPIEFNAGFNLTSGAQDVPTVRGAREASGGLPNADSATQALDAIGSFASATFREAAKTRYEKKMMDGAMAYQQGKSIDEIPMDGNKWALEGYRTMQAETASSALFAAQQMEISQGLYELDPDGFRQRYTQRVEQVLAGHDERTQDLFKQRMMQQMPKLVEQHTREHMKHVEGEAFDSLAVSVAQLSIDPAQTDNLVSFATGNAGSTGLSEDRRKAAVIRGIETAYENDNPLAYSVLKSQGVLANLSLEETQSLRRAQASFEQRKLSQYNEEFFKADQALIQSIERGDFPNPMEAVAARSALLAEHHITMNYAQAAQAYGQAQTSNQSHHRAVTLEMETARMQGDYARVAELSAPFARSAMSQNSNTFMSAISQFEAGGYDTLFGNSESRFGVRVSQMTIGELLDFSAPSGQYGQWVAASRRDGRTGQVATPMGKFQIVGSTLRRAAEQMGLSKDTVFTSEVQHSIAEHLARQRLQSANTMTGKVAALRSEWDGFRKASDSTMMQIVDELEGRGAANYDFPDFDQERWITMVEHFGGDLETASVAYANGDIALGHEWKDKGRPDELLDDKTRQFMRRVNNEVTGHRFVTARSREAVAEAVYQRVAQDNAIDVYARMEPQLRQLDASFVSGDMDQATWKQQRDGLFNEYQVRRSVESVNRELAAVEARTKAEEIQAVEAGDEQYARNLAAYRAQTELDREQTRRDVDEILSMSPMDGESPEAFLAWQAEAIAAAHQNFTANAQGVADNVGIKFKDQKLEDLITKASSDTYAAFNKAQEQATQRALTERAMQEGRLHNANPQQAAQAHDAQLEQAAQRARKATAHMSPDERAAKEPEVFQQEMEQWYARTGYVPPEMQQKFNAALTGALVQDGDVNQYTMEAVQAYASMRQRNQAVADRMMSPEAKAVADAVLMLSGNNPDQMPQAIKQLWLEGLDKAFRGEPTPDFMARVDVQKQVREAIHGTRLQRLMGKVFGEAEGSFRSQDLSNTDLRMLEDAVKFRIENLHSMAPGLNPKYIIDSAVEQVANSMFVVPREVEAGFFRGFGAAVGGTLSALNPFGEPTRRIADVVRNPTGNSFVLDPFGGNVREQMFGADRANSFNANHVTQAISGYLASDQFRAKAGIDFNVGQYEITPIGNGQLMVEFRQRGDTGNLVDTFTRVIEYRDAGEWLKSRDRSNLTQ